MDYRSLNRSRTGSRSVRFGLSHHRFSWDRYDDQAATFATALIQGHRVWDIQRVAVSMALSADAGHFGHSAFEGQDEFFWQLGVDVHAWKPVDVAWLPGGQKLVAWLIGQLSGSHLPSSRRLSLGGFNRARGFERSTFLADRGVVVGLDFRVPLRLGEWVLFSDAGYGDGLNDVTSAWGHVIAFGVGWDGDLLANVASRLSWTVPVAAKGTGNLSDDGPKLFWEVRYEY